MSKHPPTPESIPIPETADYDSKKNERASLAIGGYNSMLKAVPLIDSELIFLFQRREAETSTRLEGTYVTFEQIVLEKDSAERDIREKRTNAREAFGVILALKAAEYLLKNRPFSATIIKAMHKELMTRAVRDQGVPGKFRRTSASVGREGGGPRYTAPEAQHIDDLMSDLERYMHRDDNMSSLVKIAIVHGQFEIIHPFGDGNGRTGRLLIPILMKQYGLTDDYSFFISKYFEKNREAYYTNLNAITAESDWSGWINFFLDSVAEHAKSEAELIKKLQEKYIDGDFLKFTNASSQHIKNFIFKEVVFTVPDLIRDFEKEGVSLKNQKGLGKMFKFSEHLQISEKGQGRRPTIFSCPKILEILRTN